MRGEAPRQYGPMPGEPPAAMRHCRIDPGTRTLFFIRIKLAFAAVIADAAPAIARGPSSARASGCKKLARSTAAMGHGDHGLEVIGSGRLAQGDARGGYQHRTDTQRAAAHAAPEWKKNLTACPIADAAISKHRWRRTRG